ncbi:calcium-binding protein [Albimonas pacifica]|uniref:Hemolysin-type calcium-binding repeat-containing protein n=1 Tax=Albimonas pacifica TaxID=1114924 RepID=A0A1I3D375_9RHOB|nr:calcium-binding protein [Albimonas pacifica]SFH81162.1 Hemolysin-type calcium-binding repeat-containing protein [Albimonas pacifica]
MPGRKAKFKQTSALAEGYESPAEALARIYGAEDFDLTFERTGRKGELVLEGAGLRAVLRVTLDRKGREKDIEQVEIRDAAGRLLARGENLEADVDRFFRELNRALDHYEDGDVDGALHHLANLYEDLPMRFVGTRAGDRILGTTGADAILGRGGSDVILGSLGRDMVDGGGGYNSLFYGSVEVKTRQEGLKADLSKNKATILGDKQEIRKFVELGGTDGRDQIKGDARGNYLSGGDGDDRLDGAGGDDFVYGGNGRDRLFGGSGDDYVDGGNGDDEVSGGSGDDFVYGGAGHDAVDGDSGDDTLEGGAGNDTVNGGSGADVVRGGEGDDTVSGGSGDDVVDGGSGDDTLEGGGGTDTLTGGGGADEFRLSSQTGADVAADFQPGEDRIRADVPFAELTFTDIEGGTEIRTSGGALVGTVLGVDAATLNDADAFL